jgi:hypothetical protein
MLDARYGSGYLAPQGDPCNPFIVSRGCHGCAPRSYRSFAPATFPGANLTDLGRTWYEAIPPAYPPCRFGPAWRTGVSFPDMGNPRVRGIPAMTPGSIPEELIAPPPIPTVDRS